MPPTEENRMVNKFALTVACAALATMSGLAAHSMRSESSAEAIPPIRITTFSEIYSSATPADWATTADHIAEVTVVDEQQGREEANAVERLVTIRVDRTRWSRPGSAALPQTFQMPAFGWVRTDAGLAELVVPDASRIEPGHRYLMALIKLEPRCNADDGLVDRGGWSVIGSGGSVPFDGADIGQGEVEGANGQAVNGPPGSVLEAAETAPDAAAIVEIVDDATASQRPAQPGVREGC